MPKAGGNSDGRAGAGFMTGFVLQFVNVKIMVSPDAIKFDSGNNTFVLLSREPADWDDFSENVPKFEDKDIEQNWASFYS